MELEEEEEEQQQQERHVIRWERFLPRRSLRVLLVENDDSTRHIVAVLLRKCSYNVAAVADGVKAWEVLQKKHYNCDLVLSEVDMPSLSGIDLLDKIMSCDLSRNIPVIMMSSQDSVNVVFKCMLKGAADFLVKPVRRNELRNLWQHVWRKHCARRCIINPIERINDNQAKSQDSSGNNVAVHCDNSYAESGPKNNDNGDEVRDTHSTCSKPGSRAKGVQKCAELCPTEMKDSSKLLREKLNKSYDSKVMIENSIKQDDYKKKVEENKEIGASTEEDAYIHEHTLSENRQGVGESDRSSCMKETSGFNEEIGGNFHSSRSLCSVPNTQSAPTIDFIGAAADGHASITLEKDAHGKDKNIAMDTLLSQDISVRRPANGFSNQGFQERHILKHSSASAFSRYGKDIHGADWKSETPATLCISPKESTTRVQPLAATQKEEAASSAWRRALSAGHETCLPRSHQVTSASSNDGGNISIKTHPPVQALNTSHSASQNDEHNVNHTCNEVNRNGLVTFHPGQIELMPCPFPIGQISIQNLYAGYGGAIMQPVLYPEPSPSAPTTARAVKEVTPSDNLGNQGYCPSYDLSSQQNCIPYHLEHERKDHTVDREQRQPEAYGCTEVGEQTDQHNHCNGHLICGGEGNGVGDITEYHGSLLISTHQGNEGGCQNANGNCLDSGRSQREAALMKFRLKRKERCFDKKVRYHSRKMLAEQRPRIKGQFVRLSTVEPTNTNHRSK